MAHKLVNRSTVSLARATLNIINVFVWMLENGENDNSAWYATEKVELSKVAEKLGFAPHVYLAAIAAFSPSVFWNKNKSEIERMAKLVRSGATVEEVLARRFMGYKTNVRKAYMILVTGDIAYLSGPKVERFYANLLGNTEEVTIDRHACNIAVNGLGCGKSGKQNPTPAMYPILAQAYSNAAKLLSVMYGREYSPASVQAITWGYVSYGASNHEGN
jgi:hypothetical protein